MTGRTVPRPTATSEPGDHSSRSTLRLVVATVAAMAALFVAPGAALAHDDIAGSSPANREQLEEPISFVDIDFGVEISDGVELFLVYDVGDGETFAELGGTTTKTGETTARLEFPVLDREGTYFVKYLAPVPADGHVVEGAISFTWGEPSGGDGGFPILPFAGIAILILGIGAWFTYRQMQVGDVEHDTEPTSAEV